MFNHATSERSTGQIETEQTRERVNQGNRASCHPVYGADPRERCQLGALMAFIVLHLDLSQKLGQVLVLSLFLEISWVSISR